MVIKRSQLSDVYRKSAACDEANHLPPSSEWQELYLHFLVRY
jgi:hypothetical protein